MPGGRGVPMFQPAITTRFFTHSLCFDILAHSFASGTSEERLTVLFSSVSALFARNTRGWGTPAYSTPPQNRKI